MAQHVAYLVVGFDGQVELRADRVIIHRKGVWNMMKYGANAKREIPLGAISEVAFKDASAFSMGEIEFVRGGRSSDEKSKQKYSSVRFKKGSQREFELLKEKIFELMNNIARQR